MERHDTHILSCSSSLEHSYKFDKNGNLILDSLSSVSFTQNKQNNKIKTSEIFKDLKNRDDNTIEEEDYFYKDKIEKVQKDKINIEFNKDNNMSFSQNMNNEKEDLEDNDKNKENNDDNNINNIKNEKEEIDDVNKNNRNSDITNNEDNTKNKNENKNLKMSNNFQIISSNQNNIIYIPSRKENINFKENNNTDVNVYTFKNIKENENDKILEKNIIKKEVNFNYIVKKYDNKDLKIINIGTIYLQSIKIPKMNINLNNNIIMNKSQEEKEKIKYEYKAKFTERMKFSSKTNSFLSPINDIIKEKDIFIKNIEHILKLPLNISNFCYLTKSPLIIKYKTNNKIVLNNICFYTKEIINDEKIKNNENKESLMFDGFNGNENKNLKDEKLLKNKFIVNDILDKKSILNKRNENEYNNDLQNSFKEENNDNVNIKLNQNDLLENNINNSPNINDDEKDDNSDNSQNQNKNQKNGKKNNNIDINFLENENNPDKKNLLNGKHNNSHYINDRNDKEISQIFKLNNNLLLSPKTTKIYPNNNILKPLNIFSSKKPKVPSSAFPTPYKPNKDTSDNKIKTFYKINQINTPSSLAPKNLKRNKLFNNESNFSKINSKRTIQNERQNRNKSLVNIIHHNNNHKIDFDLEEDKHHYHDEINLIINKGKKYERHFGKEENCPICVALQMKNKLLVEKNTLPVLNIKNYRNNEHRTNTQSPNHKVGHYNGRQKNIEKINRIMSSKPEIGRKRCMRRNESAKEMVNANNRNKFENEDEFNNKIKDEKFPCLNGYFNVNKNN